LLIYFNEEDTPLFRSRLLPPSLEVASMIVSPEPAFFAFE